MATTTPTKSAKSTNIGGRNVVAQSFLAVAGTLWLFPILYAIFTSFRPKEDTLANGYVSVPTGLTLDNYRNALTEGELLQFFWNTVIIVVPSVIFVLLLASMAAFAISRYSWRFNIFFLLLFTAGNLLPQQAIIVPLYRIYLKLPLPSFLAESESFYGSHFGIITIHVAFQLGFCTFVLANFMKALPKDLNEAAMIDGAGVVRTFWQIILPLTRPALAALTTLQVTWIYNDYFWARTLQPKGADRPITSSLSNLASGYFTDLNLLAAASIIVVLPILVLYFALQRHFIEGLTLGATKG